MRWILHWVLSAVSLLIVARVVPGFYVEGFLTALIAAVVIGLVNATLGLFIKVLTLPLTILTFGLFLLVVNALMLKFAALFVPGFQVSGFLPALLGSVILTILHMIYHPLLKRRREY